MRKNKTIFEKLDKKNFKIVSNNETMNVYGGKLSLQTFKKRAVATHKENSLDVEFKMLAD